MLWTHEILAIAKSHIGAGNMITSAQLCYNHAYALFMECKFDYANQRALKSIAYSVGIMHSDYIKVKESIDSRD